MAHLKGQNVNLLLSLTGASATQPIAASTSCDFNVTSNTTDAAAKDDPGLGDWDNPDFTNYSWTMSNESFIVDIAFLSQLLNKMVNGDATVGVKFQHHNNYGNTFAKEGKAIITSLDITGDDGDFAKINLSLDGNGALSVASETTITPASEFKARIKGKALMLAINTGSTGWKTIACAKSHKLTISCQTSDVSDKDMNDQVLAKEVTGRSVQLSTENLIEVLDRASGANGMGINDLYDLLTTGTVAHVALGYYPDSIGQSIHGQDGGWGAPGTVLLEGDFIVTSLSNSGTNKDDSTFSADFQGKGKPTVTVAE